MKNNLVLLLSLLFLSCEDKDSSPPCQVSQKDEDIACIEIYQPVCGCNNETYSNECYARKAGIVSFVDGECN